MKRRGLGVPESAPGTVAKRRMDSGASVTSERFNSVSHLLGAILATVGLAALVWLAVRRADPWRLVSVSVYGTALVALYVFSTLYHSLRGRARALFRKLDHSAIYLAIAGTYTPFALVTLRGPWGWSLLAVVWSLAALGIALEFALARRRAPLSVGLYVAMGWLAIVAIGPLARALPAVALALVVAGGLLYTLGVVFYAIGSRRAYGHGVFHVLVLGGSLAHYLVILVYVA